MKNTKRILCLMLVVMMLITAFPASALAIPTSEFLDGESQAIEKQKITPLSGDSPDINVLTRNGATWFQLQTAGFNRREIQTAFELEMMRLVNNIRADYGLPALIHNPELAHIARLRAEESMYHNTMSHVSQETGLEHTDHAREMGLNVGFAAENLGGTLRTPQALVEQWMNSAGHRRFILSGLNPTAEYHYISWDPLTQIGIGFDFCQRTSGDHNATRSALWQMNSPRRNITTIWDFNFNNLEERITAINVDHGLPAPIEFPTIPNRAGWSHIGWSPEFRPVMNNNTRFTALWERGYFDVTFLWNGGYGGTNFYNIVRNVPADTIPIPPPTPPSEFVGLPPNWRFVGWAREIHPITQNTTFRGHWDPPIDGVPLWRNLIIDWGFGGYESRLDNVRFNVLTQTAGLRPFTIPTRTGWEFAGWWPEEAIVTQDNQRFTAVWTPILRTVQFDLDGGWGFVTDRNVLQGTTTNRPAQNPQRTGFTFVDWNWDFDIPIYNNMVITALWELSNDVDIVNHVGIQITENANVDYELSVGVMIVATCNGSV